MIQFRLADDIAYCMECEKAFDKHTKKDQAKCRKHLKERHASPGNMQYLAYGFKIKKIRIECNVIGCDHPLAIGGISKKGQYDWRVCEYHQDLQEESGEEEPHIYCFESKVIK